MTSNRVSENRIITEIKGYDATIGKQSVSLIEMKLIFIYGGIDESLRHEVSFQSFSESDMVAGPQLIRLKFL